MSEQDAAAQKEQKQKRLEALKAKFSGINLAESATAIMRDFSSQSNQAKEKKRQELLQEFKNNGFAGMKPDDVILFMEQYRRGQFIFEHTDQDRQNIAEAISAMPETKDTTWFSHGKFNPLVRFNRWRREISLKTAARKLQRKEQRYNLEQAALNYKYLGTDADADAYKKSLEDAGWLRRKWTTFRYGNPGEIRDFAGYGLDKDSYDKLSWRARIWLEFREKRWMKDAPADLLEKRRKTIEMKIAELQTQLSEGISKSGAKKANRQLRQLNRLLTAASTAEKQRKLDYNTKQKDLRSNYEETAKPLCENIARRFNIFQEKTDILDQSTTRGKYLYALLQKAPASQKKELETIVLERKQQNFSTEDEFIQYVREQLKAGQFNTSGNLLKTIARATAQVEHPFVEKTEKSSSAGNENDSGTNEGNVNEGHSTQPPAPTNEWHEASAEALKESYDGSAYELVAPQREGQNADNENVLYQTFKNRDDDHLVTVEKADANNYNLSAKDKDGKDSVPTVDDMRAAMEAMKKEGHTTMELGEIKTPEFLARAIVAAEESGIQITNLKEVREKMAAKGLDTNVKEEKAKAATQSVLKGTQIDTSKEGIQKTVNKMDALVVIQGMPPEKYEEYKQSDEYKKLKLNAKEEKLFDGINKLKNNTQFKSQNERKQAMMLGRMICNYQKAFAGKTNKGGAQTKAKRNFVAKEASRFNLATVSRSSSR